MLDNDTKRLTRLTAILTQLQSKRIVTASKLAEKFAVSNRTIYRDIKSLENAGVPVITEDGKGYTLMDGYKIPPIMFTEDEANALLTAELIICKYP
jgi:predicted DNA-binding transcriptional regulator YafY